MEQKHHGINAIELAREYPLPALAAIGLIVGILAYFIINPQSAHILWYAVLVIGGAPLVASTVQKVFGGRFASDIIATLAIVVAILMGEAFAGAIIVLMQSGGEALESYGLKRASSSLQALMERAPKYAWRKTASGVEKVPVEKVRIGEVLVVRHGDQIPVDGVIRSGRAYVDEAVLTGEAMPQLKKKGDKVFSGTINASGTFEMTTTALSKESQYAKIVNLVRKAQKNKPHIERLADKYAIWFTPLTLVLSALGYFVTGSVGTILAVLVVATPCPLIIAVPIAVIAGINKAANDGIIVKSGAAIEQVGNAKTLFFDKTGTVTMGTPMVDEVLAMQGYSTKEILRLVASVEQLSAHPLASAILEKSAKEKLKLAHPTNFKEFPSKGLRGNVKGKRVAVGSRKFMKEETGSSINAKYESYSEAANKQGKMCLLVSIDKKLAGVITLNDEMRPHVRQTISKLKKLGIEKTIMLTGDNAVNANAIAKKAGIDEFRANLLPHQKSSLVKAESRGTKVTVMVGDGINDAPALATATVGVAMGAHGTAISSEAADVVLLVDDISKVESAVSIGKRMSKIAKQSIFVGIGASLCLMVIAGFGYIPAPVGAVLQELLDITVILNALRVR